MESNIPDIQSLVVTTFTAKDLRFIFRTEMESYFASNPKLNNTTSDEWFDLIELCNYLPEKPARPTVYGWVHALMIPYHKRAKKLFFLKSEIDAWLKEGRKKTFAERNADAETFLKTSKKKKVISI